MSRASILYARIQLMGLSLLLAAASAIFVRFYSDVPLWPNTIMVFLSMFVVMEVQDWLRCRFTKKTIWNKMLRATAGLAIVIYYSILLTALKRSWDYFFAGLVTYFAFLLLAWIYLWIQHARKARSSANR